MRILRSAQPSEKCYSRTNAIVKRTGQILYMSARVRLGAAPPIVTFAPVAVASASDWRLAAPDAHSYLILFRPLVLP